MNKKFSVIVADPPWNFKDTLNMSDVKRGALANYSTMSILDIKQLSVKDIADPDGAILCLWVPSAILQDGLDVMKAWSFSHKQIYIWNKSKILPFKELVVSFSKNIRKALKDGTWQISKIREILNSAITDFDLNKTLSFGMGRLFRNCHEICLIGTNGNKIYKQLQNRSQRSVSFAPNLGHSTKPEHLQNSLEIMFPSANKLELFARRVRPNWECLGNEIDGLDIRDALDKLK